MTVRSGSFWKDKQGATTRGSKIHEILKHENEADHAENHIRGLKGDIESQELNIRRTLEKGMRSPGHGILRLEMGELSQTCWSRIGWNNVVFTKDKENVGNGKLTGSVRTETNAVYGPMKISAQKLRHSLHLLRSLRRSRMGKIQQKWSPGGRSPSGRKSRLPYKAHL